MNNLLKQAGAGLRVLLVLTAVTGILYPLAVWGVTRLPGLRANAEAVDTTLVGIDRDGDRWFHTRPSAATLPASGGSNKSQHNTDYDTVIAERRTTIAQRENVPEDRVPQDAVTASASGLDPHISTDYAELQIPRVARENGIGEDRVRKLVTENTDGRDLGFLGEPGVNVTALNRALDAAK